MKRIFCLVLCLLLALPALALGEEAAYEQPELAADSVEIIDVDGYQFKDLNKNGALDPYEDWRLSAEERTADLLSQMTNEEKAARVFAAMAARLCGVHVPLIVR